MKIIEDYYKLCIGVMPTKEEYARTYFTALYLKDNNYTNIDIFKIFNNISKKMITIDDLPNELWNDSLIEKNRFYFHNLIHIKSKPPTWDPISMKEKCEPFYLEMKINFTEEDLLNYFYLNSRMPVDLRDEKRDKAALMHLFKKYDKTKINGLDFLLSLIDTVSQDIDKEMISNVFELEDYNKEVFDMYSKMLCESEFEKVNKIVWRS